MQRHRILLVLKVQQDRRGQQVQMEWMERTDKTVHKGLRVYKVCKEKWVHKDQLG
jgi:hypothetical protein